MRWKMKWAALLGMLSVFLVSTAFAATTKTAFTECADFSTGISTDSQCTAGSLNLVASEGQTSNIIPVIWVPNSETTSVSKVDTLTGRELGRYRSAPDGQYGSPSRTTVDINGNVWFGNRNLGTAVKIGLYENGQCIDRNGNGSIETSADLNGDGTISADEVLPWGADECVLLEVLLDSSNPAASGPHVPGTPGLAYTGFGTRGFAIDKSNNVWVGGIGSTLMYNIDGATGAILKTVNVASVGGSYSSYGAFADSNGIIWTNSGWTNLTRIDPGTNPPTLTNHSLNGYQAYGIAPDLNNNVIFTDWSTGSGIGKYNTQTNSVEWLTTHGSLSWPRGVAVSKDGDIWTANSGGSGVTRFGSDGTVKAAAIGSGYGPTGVSIDREGKVWAVDLLSENVFRIDPATNSVDMTKQLVGAGTHYGYSDMIGLISNATAQYQGTWTVDHDSGAAATPWGKLTWNATVPAGASIVIKARSSENLVSWSAWETATSGQFLSTIPDGRYLQVQVSLSKNQSVTAAVALNDLTITKHTIPFSQRDGVFTLTVNPVASPTNNATLNLGGSVEIGATVTVTNQTTSTAGTASVTNGSWSGTVALAPGSNTVRVYAVNGPEQLEQFVNVVLDNAAPTVTISNPINAGSYRNPVNFTYSATDNGTITAYKLKINGNTVSNTMPGNSLTLNDGANVIRLEVTDQAGNVGSAEVSVIVDNFIFAPSIDPLPPVWKQSSYTVTGKTEPGSQVSVSTSPAVTVGTVSVTGGTWSCTLSGLTNGPVVINVSASDALGNASATASATLQVALAPAPVTLQVADTRQGGAVSLDWSSYGDKAAVATYNLYYSNEPFASVSGMIPVRSFAAGIETYLATGLTNNKAAYFAVVAVAADSSFNSSVASVRAVPTRQGVEGVVTDVSTGKPLQAIRVSVAGGGNTLTDIRGYYAITGVAAGSTDISFSENPALRYVDNAGSVTVTAGQMAALNISMAVLASLPPDTPQNLSAAAADRKVALVWTPVIAADLAGYNVYRGGEKVNPGLVTAAEYTDSGLTNGVSYSYTVKAVNNAGVESGPSNEATAQPVAVLPDPPKDLKSELLCNGMVKLTWTKPASSNISGYNIYYQAGATVSYAAVAATTAGENSTTWTSPELAAGTYSFGVRTQAAAEETNQYVAATVNIPTNWGVPKASIKIPQPGQKVSGNNLHVHADISTCGAQEASRVLFQYKTGEDSWQDIPAVSVQHPNPDQEGPAYFIQWNVAGLTEGAYQVRAIATGLSGSSDQAPGAVTIYVDHNKPDYKENLNNNGNTNASGSLEKGRNNSLNLATGNTNAQINFSQSSLATDSLLNVETLNPENLGEESTPTLLQALTLQLMSGQSTFTVGSEPEIIFNFTDNDNDGFVDGTGIAVQDLVVSVWNEVTKQWDTLSAQEVNVIKKTLKGLTGHFSKFSLQGKSGMAKLPASGQIRANGSSSSGSYSVSWDEVQGAGVYYVEESNDSNFKQDVRKVYEGPGLTATVTGRKSGKYWYRVRAGKAGSDPSDWTATGEIEVALACDTPANLTAQVDNISGKAVLTWESAEPADTFFEIEMDNGSGFKTVANTMNKTIELAIGNGSYQYRVKARRTGVDDSAYTTPVSVSMTLACSTPASISSSSASGVISVSWGSSATAGVNYMLQESFAGGPFVTIYLGNLQQVSLGGRTGSGYLYRVKAQKFGLTDSVWKTATAPVAGQVACRAPGSISYGTTSSSGSYGVSWSAVAGAGAYVLEESKDSGNWASVITTGSTSTWISGRGNGSYKYRVKAQKSSLEDSIWTEGTRALVVTLPTLAPAPGSISYGKTSSSGNYTVSWTAVAGASAYVLEESKDNGNWTAVITTGSTSSFISGRGNGGYKYRVKTQKSGFEDSIWTEGSITLTVTLPTIATAPGYIDYGTATNTTGNFYVKWPAVAGATGYVLEESFNSGAWGNPVTVTTTSPFLRGKANGTYKFRVKTVKSGLTDSVWREGTKTLTVAR